MNESDVRLKLIDPALKKVGILISRFLLNIILPMEKLLFETIFILERSPKRPIIC